MSKKPAVYTTETAKLHWCPFIRKTVFRQDMESPRGESRTTVIGIGNALSDGERPGGFNCVAEHCMAWRWWTTHVNDPADPGGDLIESRDTYGYCGLAGEP